MTAFDVVVVGAGYIGSAISYYLTSAGLRTVLVDRGGVAAGASQANYGNIQVQDAELDDSLPMVLAGRAAFDTLEDELETHFGLRSIGSLLIAESVSQVAGLRFRAERLHRAGVPVEWLSPADLARLEPQLDTRQTCGALYNPNEAQVNPFELIWAFISRARQYGLQLRFHAPVEGFIVEGDRVNGVITPQGRIEGKITVLATGAWGSVLGRKLGLHLPVRHAHGQAAVTGYIGHILSNYISSAAFFETVHHDEDLDKSRNSSAVLAIAPTGHGNLLLGEAAAEVEHFGYDVSFDSPVAISALTLRFLPVLRTARILRCWGVPVAFTADDKPFVGPVSGLDGLLLALAFKSTVVITPLIGRTITQLITEGSSDLDISPFLLSRIKDQES